MNRVYQLLVGLTFLATTSAFADLPYTPIEFPRDDAAHFANVPYPVGVMDEWWYYVGKLTATDGHMFGYWVSYVSFAMNFNGTMIDIPGLQLQITDVDNQKVYNQMTLFPMNQTNLSTKTLNIQFGDTASLVMNSDGTYQLVGNLKSQQGNMLAYNLKVAKTRPSLLVGANGLVEMWHNTNSYYYSNAFLKPEGFIAIDNQKYTINPDQSRLWMDHQWGDFIISSSTDKWYWNGIQLDDGTAINFSTILSSANTPTRISATIQMPDGSKILSKNVSFKAIPPHSGYAQTEEVSFNDLNLQLTLQSLDPDQHLGGTSESIGTATGLYNGKPVNGIVQMETTVKY